MAKHNARFGRENWLDLGLTLLARHGPEAMTLERLTVADRRDPGRTREFDSIVIASDLVLVCETKSTLRPDDIPNFMQGLAEIREYLPQANGRDVVGALASFRIDPSLITAGERKGLLMFGLGTGLVRILNTKGFDPHRF